MKGGAHRPIIKLDGIQADRVIHYFYHVHRLQHQIILVLELANASNEYESTENYEENSNEIVLHENERNVHTNV